MDDIINIYEYLIFDIKLREKYIFSIVIEIFCFVVKWEAEIVKYLKLIFLWLLVYVLFL